MTPQSGNQVWPPSATVVSAEPFSHGTGTLWYLQKKMATCRHWSVSLWRDSDDVPHCRILSYVKTEWQLISAALCRWRRYFLADQLWLMTRISEEEEMEKNYLNSLLFLITQCKKYWQGSTQDFQGVALHCLPIGGLVVLLQLHLLLNFLSDADADLSQQLRRQRIESICSCHFQALWKRFLHLVNAFCF